MHFILCLTILSCFPSQRERNRLHAKHTRDRRKNFLHALEKTIQELQERNRRMRLALEKMENLSHFPTISLVTQAQMSPLHSGSNSVDGDIF